jgi:hypothetical protein
MRDQTLKSKYTSSHALIIGINNYQSAPRLQYAASDAQSVSETLEARFSFPRENIKVLIDDKATRTDIMSSYLSTIRNSCDRDSRFIFFFAGHGHTETGSTKEIGYLVPYDGSTNDVSTLVRWEELTETAELIPAKHIFFIMDACYGGLAFNRAMSAGAVRFIKDILRRPTRQALTAGKADETVSDAGGPRPEHSIFTGHLLDALEGEARTAEGIITASGIMSYVYNHVSNDIHSDQTPHYGFLSGDGDFVFQAPQLEEDSESEVEEDQLVSISSSFVPEESIMSNNPVEVIKQYLSDPKYSIQLHDLIMQHVRKANIEIENEQLTTSGVHASPEIVEKELKFYENAASDLRIFLSLVSYWGKEDQRAVIARAFSRMSDEIGTGVGDVILLSLKWYPITLMLYASGIAAIAKGNYENLREILYASVSGSRRYKNLCPVLCDEIVGIQHAFSTLQQGTRNREYVPMSEYLLKMLQPELDDAFFLGKEYEGLFDRFEVLLALVDKTIRSIKGSSGGGAKGRFAWKFYIRAEYDNPLKDILNEVQNQGENWSPFKCGLFGTRFDIFSAVLKEYFEEIIRLRWAG